MLRVGLREGGKKKSSVFQLKISVTSFLLHHILNSTCVQGVVCLSALGKKHNPCPRNICQRPTAGQRDAATRPFSEEFAPRASFMKPRFIPTIELFSFFLLQKKKKNYYEWFLSVVLIVFFFFFLCATNCCSWVPGLGEYHFIPCDDEWKKNTDTDAVLSTRCRCVTDLWRRKPPRWKRRDGVHASSCSPS